MRKQSGAIIYSEQDWESKLLGKRIVRIQQFKLNRQGYKKKVSSTLLALNSFYEYCQKQSIEKIIARVKEDDLATIHALEGAGFCSIECLLTFQRRHKQLLTENSLDHKIVSYDKNHLKDLKRIAAKAFRYSRFHSDPGISHAQANLSRVQWVINSCQGRAQKVFVAQKRNKAIGFVLCRGGLSSKTKKIGVIDLIAVDPAHKGKGLGRELVKAAVEFYAKRKLDLIVGTQAKNIPSVNLYIKTGFRLINSQLTFVKYL